MSTRKVRQLLAAVLSIVMILSLFVVPSGAAAAGTVWDFTTADSAKTKDGTANYTQYDVIETDRFEGLTLSSQVKYHGTQYGITAGNGQSIGIAVDGPCDIEVTVGYQWSIQLGDDASTLETNPGTGTTLTFHYTGEAGTATLNMKGTSYIAKIELKAASTPDPVLTLSSDSVVVKMGETATVTPTLKYATLDTAGYTLTPAADTEGKVTAAVNAEGSFVITPETAGKTTVTVSAALTEGKTVADKTIDVRVLPAEVGVVEENKTYDFQTSGSDKVTGIDNYYAPGLEWTNITHTGNNHGPNGAGSLKVYIPEGKQTTLKLTLCCFGDVSKPSVTNGTVDDGADTTEEKTDSQGQHVQFGKTYTITEAKGTVVIGLGGNGFIHTLEVGAFETAQGEVTQPITEKVWDFSTITGKAQNDPITGDDLTEKGLTLTNVKFHSTGYGSTAGKDATIGIPVEGPCNIKVEVGYSWSLHLGDDTVFTEKSTTNTNTTVTFYYTGEAGTATLTMDGTSYIKTITLAQPSEAAPALRVKAEDTTVALKVDGTKTADVPVYLRSATVADLQITSSDDTVATATAAAGDTGATLTITAGEVTESKSAVITVALRDQADQKATIAVTVDPAGEVTHYVEGKLFSFATTDNENVVKGILGLTVSNDFTYANNHGIQNAVGSTITLNLEKKANITVVGCTFGSGKDLVIESTSGKVTKELGAWNNGETDVPKIKIAGATGETTLTLTGVSTWIHSIEVTYLADEVPAADRRIQVWDFGGKVEANTALYTNNITPDTLLNAKMAAGTPTIVAGVIKTAQNTSDGTEFGNVVFAAGNNDKFFSNITELATLAGGNANATHSHDFGDGYVSAGGFITNGGGNASRRNVTVKAVKAGEVVTVYLSNHQSDTTYEVEGYADIPAVTVPSKSFGVLSFVAPEEGNYKIWANGGKPGYLRVTVTPTVTVTGSITLPAEFNATGWTLKFVDPATKKATVATVDTANNTYTVELAPGRSYNAAISGAPGWGVNAETKALELAAEKITTGETHNLTVDVRPQYTYSGTITGFAADYDTTNLTVTMVPDEDSVATVSAEEIDLTLTDGAFTAYLDCEVKYTVTLKGANDYQVKSPAEVTSASADLTGQTIEVEPKALQAVSGKLLELDVDDQFAPLYADSTYKTLTAAVTKLEFENVDDGYTYTATVSDGAYTANLRAGTYVAKATMDGYSTQTHVVVADQAVTRDLLFVSTATPDTVAYAADVYVGDAAKSPNFKTVTGALAYIERMGTRDKTKRVTVHIAPGTYREQIAVETPYVTFVNDDPSKEVKLTWYYGIGYKYYSVKFVSGTEAWYDPELAFDRYEKADYDVSRWGATVRVRAPGFQAENVTFENSFNYYVTDEEVYDGAVYNGKQSIKFARDPGADVASKAATERAAAIWVDTNSGRGDMTEFKNCKFLSSQDTFGTGKRMYLKDCYIEGMTDFICGPGDCVFDTCTLNWKGYSEKEQGGYLTAPQTNAAEKGYLFRNCYVSGDTKLMLVGGSFGRTWGAENTKCLYLNTTLQSADMIVDTAEAPCWTAMQGFDPKNSSTLLEWGTKLEDGTPVDLSKRQLQNAVLTSAPTVDVKSYFGDWTPDYYTEEADTVAIDGNVSIVDNGDINLPYPGHTLTVVYTLTPEANNANDASVIQWYRVKDGAETLVKSSFANADKTYKIDKADVGAQIKVTVTPTTISGTAGEAKSATVEKTVLDGFDDPSGETDPVLGDGVNIFLAGDSTVKHYGATGMHQGGKIGKEGSWGEFLQAYFNDKVTVANYANGGRSTRNFINEGKLDAIANKIGEGDYLFIQFGHNDCADGASYIEDRYVPLGTPDGNGVYPVTAGTKSATPDSLKGSYGAEWYAWDCGGTYKWFLKQYVDVAKNAGATPVLITPVARMYYESDGTIKPHHDAERDNTNNNAYCEAVKQLAKEENVLLIDGYALTEKMYEDAWKACGNDTNGKQVMATGDKTHSNKLGGMIEAALIAQAVQGMDLNISTAVQAPGAITGKTEADAVAFTVDADGKFAAYDTLNDYTQHATYWEGVGQALIDAIAGKTPVTPDKPVAVTKITVTAPATEVAVGGTVALTATVEPDDATEKGVTWTSSDAAVATVDASGVVTGVAAGKVTITATTKEAGSTVKGTVELNVVAPADALAAAIKAAQAELDNTMVSTDGSDVSKRDVWTTQPVRDTMEAALKAAKAVAEKTDPAATADELIAATDTLNKAVKTFVAAQKEGTKRNTGTPSYGPSSKPTTTVTETSTNDKGDVATTVTKPSGDKEITVVNADGETVAEIKLPASIPTPTTKFKDVPEGHWAEESINHMAGLGMVNGVNEAHDLFDMESTMTRASVATMFFRLSNGKTGIASTFEDVPEGQWYSDAIGWAAKTGVVNGYSETAFGPDDTITRQQLAVMLQRYANLIGMDAKAHASALDPFVDGAEADDWAVEGLAWCVKNGIMKGRGGDVLDPTAQITRAEATAMFDRVIALMQK